MKEVNNFWNGNDTVRGALDKLIAHKAKHPEDTVQLIVSHDAATAEWPNGVPQFEQGVVILVPPLGGCITATHSVGYR